MASGYVTAHVSDATALEGMPGTDWLPLRERLGIGAFGVNAWRAREVGADVIEEHDEKGSGHEELYLVVSGRARFTLGDEELDAPAGTLVFVEPRVNRVARALEVGTTVMAIGAKRGKAFTPSAWERTALA